MRHRWLLFCLVGLSAITYAQVTVTSQGFATSSGWAVPGAPISPPLLYTPSVHLGDVSTATVEVPPGVVNTSSSQIEYPAGLQSWGTAWQVASAQPGSENILTAEQAPPSAPVQAPISAQAAGQSRFNFGVAQFDSPYSRFSKDESRSLAEIAAAAKKHKKPAVRTYSNEDIEKLKR
ncbi:MAG TPA: hypothetical protein VEG30_09975 [Terriglobales bacterium]|nr:hypothetical protein [Terriglobales bacterium]